MTRKEAAVILAIGFAGGLAGANVQPVLTGAGKILFPGTTPPAAISASSGALTVAAGGSNQNVVISPSGTGVTSTAAALNINTPALPAFSPFLLQANSLGALALQVISADNAQVLFDSYRSASSTFAANATAARIVKNAAQLRFQYANGLSVGGAIAAFSTGVAMDLATGYAGFGGNTTITYPVDATGDINASGSYRSGATVIVDASLNASFPQVTVTGGSSATVVRCLTAGSLPIGALTVLTADCGTFSDTGLRLK